MSAVCYRRLSSADWVGQLCVAAAPHRVTECGYVMAVAPVDPEPVESEEGINEVYWCALPNPH